MIAVNPRKHRRTAAKRWSILDDPRVHHVLNSVARVAEIDVESLWSRERKLAPVRQAAMLLVREATGHSYEALGVLFGRDFSTIVWSCRMARREGSPAWLWVGKIRGVNANEAEHASLAVPEGAITCAGAAC